MGSALLSRIENGTVVTRLTLASTFAVGLAYLKDEMAMVSSS